MSTGKATRPDLGSFLDSVYPALWERLDAALPEFQFARKGEAWVAGAWPATLALHAEDKRPERLMVYRDRPWYLKLHGHQGVRLLEVVAGEPRPRGEVFVEAAKRLATLAGVPFPDPDPSPAGVARSVALEERRRALEVAVEAFAENLFLEDHPTSVEAREFLRVRGFTKKDAVDLELGLYLDRGAIARRLEAAGVEAGAARDCGVLWEKLEGYITVPWRDAAGRVLTVYGRWREKRGPADGRPKTIALPGADTKGVPLYLDRARRAGVEELVLVEGVFDAAFLHARGDARAVASVAAQLSGNQLEALKRGGTRRVVVCGDPDGGGDRGNEANVRLLLNAGIAALVAPRLPDGLDPDELVARDGVVAWRAHVHRATSGPAFLVDRALGEAKKDDADADRRAAADRALGALSSVPPSLDEGAALASVASRTGYPRRALEQQLRALRAKAQKTPKPTSDREKPVIRTRPELEDVANEAEQVLVDADVGVYQRSDALVHVARNAAAPRILALPKSRLYTLMAQHAVWVVAKRLPNGDTCDARILPPRPVVDEVFERGTWKLPELEAVVVAPTLRPDGSVIDEPGYDPETRLIYEPSCAFPRVPDHPDIEDARRALVALHEPFKHFPFRRRSDSSAALALVLTVLGRAAFTGATPLFMIRATVRGSGKQLLAELVSTLALGGPPPTFAAPREDAEWEKKLATHVRSGDRLTVIDEAQHLSSPVLSHAVTQEYLTARILGVMENVRGRMPVLVSCGNQTTFAHDLGRRLVPIEIDPRRADPERRKLPDAVAYVRANRPALVVAALTVLRAYVQAGRPDQGLFAMGSFSGWSDLVRSALVWAGLADPGSGQDRVCAEADVGADDTGALLRAWHDAAPGEMLTARAIVTRASLHRDGVAAHAEWLELLLGLDDKQRDGLNSRKLGVAFKRLKDRIVGEYVLRRGASEDHHGGTWGVEHVGKANLPHSSPDPSPFHILYFNNEIEE